MVADIDVARQSHADISPEMFDTLALTHGLHYIAKLAADDLPEPEPEPGPTLEPEPEPESKPEPETINLNSSIQTENTNSTAQGCNGSNASNVSGCTGEGSSDAEPRAGRSAFGGGETVETHMFCIRPRGLTLVAWRYLATAMDMSGCRSSSCRPPGADGAKRAPRPDCR